MLVAEWEALKSEAEGGLREARLARGTFRQGLIDFEKTLLKPTSGQPSARGRSKSGPPQITLEEHLALIQAQRAEAPA